MARRLHIRLVFPEVPMIVALLLALFPGCADEQVCTDLAAVSAQVAVVDEDGVTPLVATVTATDEAGRAVEVSCADATVDAAACTEWIVGYEVSGRITIHGEATDECGNTGTGDVVVDVPMDDAGCHVVQQSATLTIAEWTDLGCPD